MNFWNRGYATCIVATCITFAGCGGPSERDLLASAKDFLAAKDESAAIVQLKSALQKNPQSGEARFLLGDALLKSGDPTAALLELEKSRAAKYRDDLILPSLAKALVATGQAKKVSDTLGEVTLADPYAAAELKGMVAIAYFAQGRIDLGEVAVKAAMSLDPKNVTASLLQARLLAGHDQVDGALSLIDQVIARDAKQVDAWQLKGELLWFVKSDSDSAIKAFRQALAVDERFLPSRLTLIRVLMQKGDLEGFKTEVAALKKAAPGRPEALVFETEMALLDQDLKRARDGAQQLIRLAPDNAQIRYLAGLVEFHNGALRVAEDHLNRAMQLVPDLPAARRLLAETHLRSGQPAKALTSLQPLLTHAKPGADVLALAAEAHLQNGDAAKAEAYFSLAAKANPDDPKLRTAMALTEIAKGNADSGLAQLDRLSSSSKSTYSDLALISARLQRNDLDGVAKAIDRLQNKTPDKPLPHLLKARVLSMRKDMVGARASLDKAVATDASYFPCCGGVGSLTWPKGSRMQPSSALKHS
ncbi:MAG: PEP-CTERM system TPR-repeat protein PrsT [Ideonella sp.]|nr:PEP-CTERM system TPR-repeat protein PrsT [Ideonella sp.]